MIRFIKYKLKTLLYEFCNENKIEMKNKRRIRVKRNKGKKNRT